MKADGNEVFRKMFGWNDPGTYNLCGDDTGLEKKMLVEVVFGHTEASLELELSSTLTGNA